MLQPKVDFDMYVSLAEEYSDAIITHYRGYLEQRRYKFLLLYLLMHRN